MDDGKTANGQQNWRIKLLTSGTLIFTRAPGQVQLFLLGGGGGGGAWGGGGGGGYTKTTFAVPSVNTAYVAAVGAGGAPRGGRGGATSVFGISVEGGYGGTENGPGGNGGSGGGGRGGGAGGVDGADGQRGVHSSPIGNGGIGQRTTTREFGEAGGTLYANGGEGMNADNYTDAAANTGNGGDSNGNYGVYGGSGIVVIRNAR